MSFIKCTKFKWVGMGARPSPPPTPNQILKAKEWVKNNISTDNWLIPYRMRRILKLWAWNAIPSHKSGDVFFDKQDFLHNRSSAKNKSDLNATCLEPWLAQEITWRIAQGHKLIAFIVGLRAIDKEIDYTLGMVSRAKNSYPNIGEKLMYEAVVELAKMTNSVYSYYAPNIK
jgi:hypothetical protein